jgi:hypothetical protein
VCVCECVCVCVCVCVQSGEVYLVKLPQVTVMLPLQDHLFHYAAT